jgi:hypothetical protein
MSMIGCFLAVSDDDLKGVIEEPSRINTLLGRGMDMEPAPQESPPFLRIFGAMQSAPPGQTWEPQTPPKEFDVDKAWQGIHFLLTQSEWEGDGPLAFILHGGTEIEEDLGYGPPHAFTSAEVKDIAAALGPITPESLYEKADPAEFAANDIYPQIWDEPKDECIGYVTSNFDDLKKFVQETADSGSALIVFLG